MAPTDSVLDVAALLVILKVGAPVKITAPVVTPAAPVFVSAPAVTLRVCPAMLSVPTVFTIPAPAGPVPRSVSRVTGLAVVRTRFGLKMVAVFNVGASESVAPEALAGVMLKIAAAEFRAFKIPRRKIPPVSVVPPVARVDAVFSVNVPLPDSVMANAPPRAPSVRFTPAPRLNVAAPTLSVVAPKVRLPEVMTLAPRLTFRVDPGTAKVPSM